MMCAYKLGYTSRSGKKGGEGRTKHLAQKYKINLGAQKQEFLAAHFIFIFLGAG